MNFFHRIVDIYKVIKFIKERIYMDIKAFKAYRFNDDVVGNAGDCISPPYDIIDEDTQSALYEKNQYNVARIIKGKTSGSDTDDDNVYTRSAGYFNDWISKGALKADENDTIYAYVQHFNVGGEAITRSGFVALGKLAGFGEGVQPHEKTLDGPKADRLNLMRATGGQFGQIFMLYDDPEKVADKIIDKAVRGNLLLSFTDEESVTHEIYGIDSDADIQAIRSMMADKSPVIADGHHRYETALNYFNETKNPAAQYRMMTFVNMRNEGLVVLPTHRLVAGLKNFDIEDLVVRLGHQFEVNSYTFSGDEDKNTARDGMFTELKDHFQKGEIAFGIYAADNVFYVAALKDTAAMDKVCPEMSDAAKKLDVNVLHKIVLEDILGIGDKELAGESNIKYIKDIGNAIERSIEKVDSKESQAVFFMNPTRVDQVRDVAAENEKMPQKSTFFYPKIFTGLVINKL